ncbi:MAG: coenzyme F430 synthase [Methanolinea sp.]|nr:coenzyme F430 synthase [Methanolinea sp.]
MNILVLDTIHGGKIIARFLRAKGYTADMVDVYREKDGISPREASGRDYDLVIAPVHLDPAYPLLRDAAAPVITHHQAVRWIMGKGQERHLVEITGARGKTTTAHALAHVLSGAGVLHTSRGSRVVPGGEGIGRMGITPASLLAAAEYARSISGWLVGEVSLGFCGAGAVGILTSMETYRFAAGKKDALAEKLHSGSTLPCLVTPPGTEKWGNRLPCDAVATADGSVCHYEWGTIHGRFENPLLACVPYREPLLLAVAAACVMGQDPKGLSRFAPLEGRLCPSWSGKTLVVDDSNSGTCARTAREAISHARALLGRRGPLTLVIGKEPGSICEGFPAEEIASVIGKEDIDHLVLVGDYEPDSILPRGRESLPVSPARTLEEGRDCALRICREGAVVLAVKAWR